jgi:hypothetical protein
MTRLFLLAVTWLAHAPVQTRAPEIPAEITDTAAREHFAAGMRAWLDEDYPTAERELQAAYDRDTAPVLLYSLGQLARLQGDCTRARRHFLAYLATDPPEAAAADTRVNLERCQGTGVAAPLEPAPEPAPRTDIPATSVEEPATQPRTKRPDAAALSLTIAGATIAAAGIGVFGGSFAVRERANDATDFGDFDRGVRRSDALHTAGIALMSVGAAVLVGGVVRWIVVGRRRTKDSAANRRSSIVRARR